MVDAHDFETSPSFGDKVEAAIRIFLHYSDDFGGASHIGETFLQRAHDTEGAILSAALRNHFFIPWFENVKRQGSAGEEDDIEREEGDKDVQEISGKCAGSARNRALFQIVPQRLT